MNASRRNHVKVFRLLRICTIHCILNYINMQKTEALGDAGKQRAKGVCRLTSGLSPAAVSAVDWGSSRITEVNMWKKAYWMTVWRSLPLYWPLSSGFDVTREQARGGEKGALNEIIGGPEGHFHQADKLTSLSSERLCERLYHYMEKLFVWWEWIKQKRARARERHGNSQHSWGLVLFSHRRLWHCSSRNVHWEVMEAHDVLSHTWMRSQLSAA